MAQKDVIVVVQRDALPKEKENLDILLVSTTGAHPVEVYRDIEMVKAVFGPDGPCPNSKVVRKATTLLNQGKTTLADTLVSKFKIVGFEPPSAAAALPAKFTLDFTEMDFSVAIPTGSKSAGMTRLWSSLPLTARLRARLISQPCSQTPPSPKAARPTLLR